MAASVLRRSVSEEEREAANKATENQVAGIFSSFSLGRGAVSDSDFEAGTREHRARIVSGEIGGRKEAAEIISDSGEGDGEERGAAVNVVLEKPERKTRRVQLVMTETVYRKSKEMAEKMGMSLNDYIHTLLARMGQG